MPFRNLLVIIFLSAVFGLFIPGLTQAQTCQENGGACRPGWVSGCANPETPVSGTCPAAPSNAPPGGVLICCRASQSGVMNARIAEESVEALTIRRSFRTLNGPLNLPVDIALQKSHHRHAAATFLRSVASRRRISAPAAMVDPALVCRLGAVRVRSRRLTALGGLCAVHRSRRMLELRAVVPPRAS